MQKPYSRQAKIPLVMQREKVRNGYVCMWYLLFTLLNYCDWLNCTRMCRQAVGWRASVKGICCTIGCGWMCQWHDETIGSWTYGSWPYCCVECTNLSLVSVSKVLGCGMDWMSIVALVMTYFQRDFRLWLGRLIFWLSWDSLTTNLNLNFFWKRPPTEENVS